MKKCYIVGAGDFYGSINPCQDDMVIAADGGVEYLISLGIVPDVIVGDFDSLGENGKSASEVLERVKNVSENGNITLFGKSVEVFRHPVMKDETDTYLAYEIGVSRGYTEFELYGGVGGREDHTFANYCLLLKAKNDKNNMILVGNGTKIFVLKNEKKEIFGKMGATVSVFAFASLAKNVCVRGLKYEAKGIDLAPDFPLGVSNSFLSSGKGEISVSEGALLVVVYD